MPRTRGTELPQRRALTNIRTSSSSDSDPINQRLRTERTPKVLTGRSPRSEPVNPKKLGTRIAGLESQLGQAQKELKCLKDQLVSAQEQLDKKAKRVKKVDPPGLECETCVKETDVFEVPMEAKGGDHEEMMLLKSKLDEKEKELDIYRQENAKMKMEMHEKTMKLSTVESEVEDLGVKLSEMSNELEKRRMEESRMREKEEEREKAKEGLENEMRKLRVQTEQWRKAADAAASVLAGETERCGLMDKNYGNVFDYVGSPEDCDEGYRGGKWKGSGMRMFGDLWKKKGHK